MRASLIDPAPASHSIRSGVLSCHCMEGGEGWVGAVVKPMSLCPSNTIMSLEMEGMLD